MEFLAEIVEAVELRCHVRQVESCVSLGEGVRFVTWWSGRLVLKVALRLLIKSVRATQWILSCHRAMHLYRDSGAASGYCVDIVIVVMVPRHNITTCRLLLNAKTKTPVHEDLRGTARGNAR